MVCLLMHVCGAQQPGRHSSLLRQQQGIVCVCDCHSTTVVKTTSLISSRTTVVAAAVHVSMLPTLADTEWRGYDGAPARLLATQRMLGAWCRLRWWRLPTACRELLFVNRSHATICQQRDVWQEPGLCDVASSVTSWPVLCDQPSGLLCVTNLL